MIGFDRPLKPTWIYNFIKTVNIGDRITDHKPEFNKILWELDGEEGKRKVRTVLSRYFMKNEDNTKGALVEKTPILELCNIYTLGQIQPLLLFYLLMRSEVLRTLSKMIYELYSNKKDIDKTYLRKKIIEKFGERDISARSLRNFLTTLEYFDILQKQDNKYKWKKPLELNEMHKCYILKFYSQEYKKSPQIFIDEIEEYLLQYFQPINFSNIGKKYNNILWEYSQNINKKQILMHKSYEWNYTKIKELMTKSS